MKSKTEKLSDKEKSFVVFLWIYDNISYDVDLFSGRNADYIPEGVFRNGSSVYSDYSRLQKDISIFLGLELNMLIVMQKESVIVFTK